jgi:hypothetical protein
VVNKEDVSDGSVKMGNGKIPARVLVVLLLYFSILPNSGLAKYSGGTGEPNDPYQIATADDLSALAADTNDYNQCFILTADINLASNSFATAVIARDINKANSIFDGVSFSGDFNGTGHKIIKLTIDTNGAGNDYLGLFGHISGADVKNLGLGNVSITAGDGSDYLGGLTGINISGHINNCYSTGTVTGRDYSHQLGGLVGLNNGIISNCYSSDDVNSEDYSIYLGGMVGFNVGSISNCFSTGTVISVDNSHNLGGLVGGNQASISNCYFLINSGPDNGYGEPLTDEQMKQQASFVGWDFFGETANGIEDIWRMCADGVNYPLLWWQFSTVDFNCPDGVDFIDFAVLAEAWLSNPMDLNWNGRCELAQPPDNIINFLDMAVFGDNWNPLQQLPGASGPLWNDRADFASFVWEPVCSYGGYVWTRGDAATGLRYWDGTTWGYGGKMANYYMPCYLYPLPGLGMIAQTYTYDGPVSPRLEFSPNPVTTNFIDVTPVGFAGDTRARHRSLVDCGNVEGQRLLLWFEYGSGAYSDNVWYSHDGISWTNLFGAPAASINHFHGGVFCPSVGAKGRLYVFTGDSSEKISILMCDDVNDLITSPGIWYDRWYLGDRSTFVPDPNYVLGHSSYRYRTEDMVDDGNYGYWIPEASERGMAETVKVHHATKAVKRIAKYPGIIGPGWQGIYTSGGQVLFTTYSDSNGSGFTPEGDQYVHLYYVEGNDEVVELAKWQHECYASDSQPSAYNDAALIWIFEWDGVVYLSGFKVGYTQGLNGGAFSQPYYIWTHAGNVWNDGSRPEYDPPPKQQLPINTPLRNGDFSVFDGPGNVNGWSEIGVEGATITQTAEGVKIVVDSGTPRLEQYRSDSAFLTSLKDRWVTLAVEVNVESGCDVDFMPQSLVRVYDDSNGYVDLWFNYILSNSAGTNPTYFADNKWHTIYRPFYVRQTATFVTIRLYANYTDGKKGTVHFANARLIPGAILNK